MKKNITIAVLIVVILALVGVYLENDTMVIDENPIITNSTSTPAVEKMDIVVYVQNTTAAQTIDCGITQKVVVQVPKTEGIADASLRFLFSDELKAYGVYRSIEIASGTAKVMLESDMTPTGYPIGSLSSCQSQHLMSVLKDTLTQYDTIQSVKLYSQKGEILF